MSDRPSSSNSSSKSGANSRVSVGLSIAASIAIAVGATTAWVTSQQQDSVVTPEPTPSASVAPPSPTAAESPAGEASPPAAPQAVEQSLMVYWLKDTGRSLELTPLSTKVYAPDRSEDILMAALAQLFSQPPVQDVGNAVPLDTKVLSVAVKEDGVHVDVSEGFLAGGGSASMMGRLGQLIFTATTLNPNAPVWISVAGEPLTLLGGEGIEVMQPMTRQQFSENFNM
ncbi:MAG: GerMN domain-containing protein [Cyanobacteria bacterium P01_C01_bin.89]